MRLGAVVLFALVTGCGQSEPIKHEVTIKFEEPKKEAPAPAEPEPTEAEKAMRRLVVDARLGRGSEENRRVIFALEKEWRDRRKRDGVRHSDEWVLRQIEGKILDDFKE